MDDKAGFRKNFTEQGKGIFSLKDIWNCLEALREQSPLVHNITNFVVMEVTANVLLAIGASPIMAHAEEEVEEITGISSALVLNIGTLSSTWIRSMHKALEKARVKRIPVVIDPVGAGASRLRTETALSLLEKSDHALLRGNASEILALAGESGRTKGVDSTASVDLAAEAAKGLASHLGCTVCVSGEVDFVTDGKTLCFIRGGSSLMPCVTGMGCSASALVGAFAAVCGKEAPMLSMVAAMAVMAAAGSEASGRACGPGSFLPLFLDSLHCVDQNMLERGVCISPDFKENFV